MYMYNEDERTITFKTVWNEFEEKIKPLLTKPIAVSTNEITNEIETVMNQSSGEIKSNDNAEKEAIVSKVCAASDVNCCCAEARQKHTVNKKCAVTDCTSSVSDDEW